jgi:peroxidase
MDARLVTLLLLLLTAAASAPLASPQLDLAFYKKTCPDAEKIIFDIVQKRVKEDTGLAAGLLRLVFHDCFANVRNVVSPPRPGGVPCTHVLLLLLLLRALLDLRSIVSMQGCDASILIDPLSNQASEKEAGPNISVRGYDVIEDIKAELEKKCPGVVSCADIVAASARDAVRLAGGPAYKVPMGRLDSLESNRADADSLPGPDIAVPKLIDLFSKQGFSLEEMIAMIAGGHSIGICRCFFIEADAAPIDPEYRKNISVACDGKDSGSVPMDMVSPNVIDGTYFALALAKKMPLTIDRLIGMDPKTEPVLKAMDAKPADFIPLFAKAMEKLSVLKVLTGKDGEIRKSCSEFNNPKPSSDSSVIRISSINPDQMGVSQPGAAKPAVAETKVPAVAEAKEPAKPAVAETKVPAVAEAKEPAKPAVAETKEPAVAEARKVAPGGDDLAVKMMRNAVKLTKTFVKEAAAKVEGGVVVDKSAETQTPERNVELPKVEPVTPAPNTVVPPTGGEVKKEARVEAAGQVSGTAATDKAAGIDDSKLIAAGNKILGDEPASKLPGGEVKKEAAATNKAAGGEQVATDRPAPKLRGGAQ